MGFDTPPSEGAPTDAPYLTSSSDPDLSNETVVGNPENVPDFTEDGNSPKSVSGQNSITYTLASSWDVVRIFVSFTDNAGSPNTPDLTVNGDTGSNYTWWDADAAPNSQTSHVANVANILSNGTGRGVWIMGGRWEKSWTWSKDTGDEFASGKAIRANNRNVSSPLDSFTLDSGQSTDYTVEVYGRNI